MSEDPTGTNPSIVLDVSTDPLRRNFGTMAFVPKSVWKFPIYGWMPSHADAPKSSENRSILLTFFLATQRKIFTPLVGKQTSWCSGTQLLHVWKPSPRLSYSRFAGFGTRFVYIYFRAE